MFNRTRGLVAGLFVSAMLCAAPAAFANNGQGQGNTNGAGVVAGGFAGIAGGYNLTDYSGSVKGSTSSDSAGGGMAGSGNNGTGFAAQINTGGAQSDSYAAGQVGAGYVATQTSGHSTEYNVSAGIVYGAGTGQAEGQSGADYSSKASGKFNVDYTGATGNAWIGGVIGGGYATYQY